MTRGHLDLRHAVDAIWFGHGYRRDLGDLDQLCQSITTVGLLHPIVVSADGLLISGRRRLEAVKRLGWRHVPVWIAARVSDRLHTVLAIQHENTLRKDLSPLEAADLYIELKALYAEEAARRQAASRFGASTTGARPGDVESTAPHEAQDSRVQAARAITGRDSHGMLEQVVELQRIAADPRTPDWLRQQTEQALAGLAVDGKVNGRYIAIQAVRSRHELEQAAADTSLSEAARRIAGAELDNLAAVDHPAAAARAARRAVARARSAATGQRTATSTNRAVLTARRFLAYLTKDREWWTRADPQAIAAHLTDEQWDLVIAAYDNLTSLMRTVIAARDGKTIRTVN